MAKRGIITRISYLPVIKLAPLRVDYDRTVEEMVGEVRACAPDCYPAITSENFPNCCAGKHGIQELELFLLGGLENEVNNTKEVPELIRREGYIPEELPALLALSQYHDEFLRNGVEHVFALGLNSRLKTKRRLVTDEDGEEYEHHIPYKKGRFTMSPSLEFSSSGVQYWIYPWSGDSWMSDGGVWFLVRRK